MKGSIGMPYPQSSTISLAKIASNRPKRLLRYYPWVIGTVLLGHVVAFAGLTQLQPAIMLPELAKPIQIRLVELTPPPPPIEKPKPPIPEPPKPLPKLPPPPAPPKPKVVPVTPPPPIAKAPPKVIPTVAPVAKPIIKPVERKVEPIIEPIIEPVVSVTPVVTPVPPKPVSAPVVATPLKEVPIPAPVPVVVPTEPVVASPRTVAIAGVSYMKPPQVQYPESARRRGDTGTVVVRALIGADGRVDSVAIEQGSGSRVLDQAGLRAVRQASFHPYRENGVTQSVYVLIPIAFNLDEE